MNIIKRILLALVAMAGVFLSLTCSKGPTVVFPAAPQAFGWVSGFITPIGLNGTAYLFEDVVFDSTAINPATGYFAFDSVPYGAYQLRIVVPGFGIPRQVISVNENGTTIKTIDLSRLPSQIARVSMEDSTLIGFISCESKMLDNSIHSYSVGRQDTAIAFSIVFNGKMDSLSSMSALKIEPEIKHTISLSNSTSGSIMYFSFPVLEIFKHSSVTITIGKQAKTVYNEGLDFDFALHYFISTSCFSQAVFAALIQQSQPYNGQWNVAPDNDIVMEFRSMMNEQSVERALSMSPPEPMNLFWTETSGHTHQLRIVFPSALLTNTYYTVTIDSSAKTANSTRIPAPLALSFTTSQFRIVGYSPLNGDTNVACDALLNYSMDIPVDSSNFLKAFSITPAVDSMWISLQNSGKQIVVNHSPFLPRKTYTVVIDTNFTSAKGTHSSSIRTYSFTTGSAPAIIRSASPPDTLFPVPTSSRISIQFYGAMAPATFIDRLSVEPSVLFLTEWESSAAQRLTLVPMHILPSNTLFTVTVDSGYRTTWGKTGEKFVFQFKTIPLMITSITPCANQINVPLNAQIRILFNTIVDTTALLRTITFNPPMDSLTLRVDSINSENTYTIVHSLFAADTLYTVTFGAACADIYGEPMGRAFTLRFKTKKQ
jgi:hypothetical protein